MVPIQLQLSEDNELDGDNAGTTHHVFDRLEPTTSNAHASNDF